MEYFDVCYLLDLVKWKATLLAAILKITYMKINKKYENMMDVK